MDLQQLVRGSALGAFLKVLGILSGFGMHVCVSRVLGPAEAGLFFLAYSLVVLGATLGRFGLEFSIVRSVAKDHAQEAWGNIRGTVQNSFLWSLALSCVVALALVFFAAPLATQIFDKPEFAGVLQRSAFAVPFIALFTLHAYALQAVRKIASSVLVMNLLMPIIMTALVLVALPQQAEGAAWFLLVSSALVAIAARASWQAVIPSDAERPIPAASAAILASCVPLWIAVMSAQVIALSGHAMLGVWGTSADVAVFSAAQRIASVMSVLVASVNAVLGPRIAARYTGEFDAGLRRDVASASLILAFTAVIPALAMFLGAEAILAVFGSEFVVGVPALRILAVGYFVHVAAGIAGHVLAMTGHEQDVRNSVLMACGGTLIIAFALTPSYGLLGAALATSAGVALQSLSCVWLVWRRLIRR